MNRSIKRKLELVFSSLVLFTSIYGVGILDNIDLTTLDSLKVSLYSLFVLVPIDIFLVYLICKLD